jgi:hypothetical protein
VVKRERLEQAEVLRGSPQNGRRGSGDEVAQVGSGPRSDPRERGAFSAIVAQKPSGFDVETVRLVRGPCELAAAPDTSLGLRREAQVRKRSPGCR